MRALFAALAVALPVPAVPQTKQPAPRVEVPIREVKLSDGVIRYGVPITVNGADALAGLDTGASGLRLMSDAPGRSGAQATDRPETYAFGSGAHLVGTAGQVKLTLGADTAQVSAHLVAAVDCIARQPNCPGRLGLGYGFLGDGLPGEGFRVLLGANMGPTSIDTPLIALGARRWIIELPLPGQPETGRLIVNPTDAEVEGFIMLRLVVGYREADGGLHDAVWTCLRNLKSEARVCGPTLLDTGNAFIRINNAEFNPAWPPGTPMALDFKNDGLTTLASVRLTAGDPAQGLIMTTAPIRGVVLQPGMASYYAYSVLYDPRRGMIGLKARPPVEGLPRAEAPALKVSSLPPPASAQPSPAPR
jgi:hypothetical protein